jgi:hypothetical protein
VRGTLLLIALALTGCGSAPRGVLFLAGRDPGTLIRVDAATGEVTTRHLKQLGGGDPPYMVAFTGGRLVTFSLGRTSSLRWDLTRPKSLGEAWFFVPSATPGRVWNLLLKPGSNVAFRGVREVTVDGRTTAQHRAKVPGWAVGAVDDGLVLEGRKTLVVWDPATRRIVRRLPALFPVAFRGDLVASCHDPCRAMFLSQPGRERVVRLRWAPPYEGVFSPDGRLLAAPASGNRIGVIDVRSATVALIPGARTDAVYKRLAWASSGWLFYNAGHGRLGAWRPGEPARALGVRVGKFVDMAAD